MIDNPWRRVTTPSTFAPDAIGFYSAGCLRGAQALPLSGAGYEVMRPSRRRIFGHPNLLAFINSLAAALHAHGMNTLLVGDLGQPRGGPTLSGHASHQTGLDVDIWFLQVAPEKILTPAERESLSASEMVDGDFDALNARWDPKQMDVLKLASEQPDVERIFVNPMIKKAICDAHRGEPWLSKLRPELGHGDHFHARLKCPEGAAHCRAQDAVPLGDGCDTTLDYWFSAENRAKIKYNRDHPKPATMPVLPELCTSVLTEP
jgi:penicillin-insensitive murein endopeptidase